MAENETPRGAGSSAQIGSGFVVRQAENGRQTNRSASQGQSVGGFVVTDAAENEQQDTGTENSTIGVEQPLPRSRRCSLCGQTGHTARNCTQTNVARTAPKAPSGAAISMTAPLLVGTFNLMVIEAMGDNCGITEKEAQFLIPSTQRTLERMPKGAAEKMAVVIDPAIILAIVIMWMRRIGQIKREEARQKYVVAPQEAARAAGVSGSEYRVPEPDPGVDNGMAYRVIQSDWQGNGNYVPPASSEIPVPEHPDMTANGVPSVIRESFDGL